MAIGHNTPVKESRFAKLKPSLAAGGPFQLVAEYQRDKNIQKVDLIIGAYRDDNGKPWPLPSVTEAKKNLKIESQTHEYLPLRGCPDFLKAARQLIFGPKITEQYDASIASIQTVSGTGANSLIAAFLQRHSAPTNIWLPNPTWPNHPDIWQEHAPGMTIKHYPYYRAATHSFDFTGMIDTLNTQAQDGDAILLHACAHNPTGLDPSKEQWKTIASIASKKRLFVIFDLAYQGFASGNLDLDAWAVRYFCTQHRGLEMAVCQSFSKTLGLYGERTGALHVVSSRDGPSSTTLRTAATVEEHLVNIHRATVSMAPRFGSQVATEILGSAELQEKWKADLAAMSGRIAEMRRALYDGLVRLKTPGNWEHIIQQTGMFSYTGLSNEEVALLKKEFSVYLLPSGRASICGLTVKNVGYTAEAIHRVVLASRGK
ncbi:pyridoxal phosphate-dependent transferase [Aspergillus californicus]